MTDIAVSAYARLRVGASGVHGLRQIHTLRFFAIENEREANCCKNERYKTVGWTEQIGKIRRDLIIENWRKRTMKRSRGDDVRYYLYKTIKNIASTRSARSS